MSQHGSEYGWRMNTPRWRVFKTRPDWWQSHNQQVPWVALKPVAVDDPDGDRLYEYATHSRWPTWRQAYEATAGRGWANGSGCIRAERRRRVYPSRNP